MEEILKTLLRIENKIDKIEGNEKKSGQEKGVTKKMDSLGRVTIPITFRRILNLEENTELELSLIDNSIIITPKK